MKVLTADVYANPTRNTRLRPVVTVAKAIRTAYTEKEFDQPEVSMTYFFFFGTYTNEAIGGIDARRTKLAEQTIEGYGGTLHSVYALLGRDDIVMIAELPGIPEAMQVSITLHKKTGIRFSSHPALPVVDFDRITAGLG